MLLCAGARLLFNAFACVKDWEIIARNYGSLKSPACPVCLDHVTHFIVNANHSVS